MPSDRANPPLCLTRRHLLASLSSAAVLAGAGLVPQRLNAQETALPEVPAEITPPAAVQRPFSFEMLTDEMRAMAAAAPVPPATLPDTFLSHLTYDHYRLIRFDPERARFADVENRRFLLHAFHLGWLFKEPVLLYEVKDGEAQPMGFDTDDFIYERESRAKVPEHEPLPGVAGFRLHTPLNRPDLFDELVAFQGASYFRALGRNSAYGLSARGLAVNTGLSVAEEFPRFTRFWIQRPEPGSEVITIWAALESDSLTGAYKFTITPGFETVMEVTARLFFRADVQQLGIAPLTSMFLFAERNRADFDDFRPNVHDSDGLGIVRADGDLLWRPLANPPRLASSYFSETAPQSFGLYQRDREFDHYQDDAAHYEKRPSCVVEPIGDWGKGVIRLVEIPSDLEVNDNIVAFWIPETEAKAGESREFSYRLRWGDLEFDPADERAHVKETRAGEGGVSGVENTDGTRKFVIDFVGGLMDALPHDAAKDLTINASAWNGEIVTKVLSRNTTDGIWRLVLDVRPTRGDTVELAAHIAGYGRKLTETWLYQWIHA
ncbi:glucans biosynthesis protein [Rhodobacter aestuarii]|uniref:Glucans biosynthesis protein n=1 Tax=Rhodobacter aestuarii TaxID=453582 RepID=A0A1N7Q962_9RHOB|nr:glucan biosynthesis protein G [Rhodobacter aestuarii]PTV93764.1 glucans biosynthesis protein [Rhodobacter aestuarii]SIT19364.1 glucans biosynthesis protein [Rhodobacter aestuarii]